MKWKSLLQNDAVIGALSALAAFAVYLATLGPSIGFIDAGELAAVAYSFGVAHPTGYPLFTVLAGLFAHLPLGGTVIWKLNLLSALCCAASVFFFHRIFLSLLARGPSASSASSARWAAALGALILAFSRTFWSQATGVEVYSLHLLLVSLVLWSFLRALPQDAFASSPKKPSPRDPSARRARWFAFSLILGLSFTNHMTTLLLLPGLFYAYFAVHGLNRPAWKNAGFSLPFFLAGLLPYLYLPWRAAAHPAMNWGAIVDLPSFLWHVSGRQYSGWMFSSLEPAARQSALFLKTWPSEFGYAAWALALVGVVVLFRRARRLFLFTLVLFLGCLLYAINYDIHDVVNYFLLAYVVTALWAAFGLRALLDAARGRARFAALAIAAACVILSLGLHYRDLDESGNHAVEDYARNLLESTEPNAVIFSTQWDHFVAAAWYLQVVEGVRPDVIVVDRELLRRSWYLRHLSQRYPEWTSPARGDLDAFAEAVRPFEHRQPYSAEVIQFHYDGMIRALVQTSLPARPVYSTPEVDLSFGTLGRLPAGALVRWFPPGAETVFQPREISFRPFPKDNVYFQILRGYYANAFVNQGVALGMRGDLGGCEYFLRKALAVKPDSREAIGWMQRLQREKARVSAASAPPG